MKAKIYKIDPLKSSRAEKQYRRIYFLLEDGKWAKTDIVPAYHNFKRWKSIINLVDAGARIFVDGLEMRTPTEVDADSPVQITLNEFSITKAQGKKFVQESLL